MTAATQSGHAAFPSRHLQLPALTIAAVANESTNFTTPTSTFTCGVIKELYPDQFV
ncbi:hypothetical protein ACVBEQ_09935 [Nakamurella sp. GG22]